jgi:hypothetical protein
VRALRRDGFVPQCRHESLRGKELHHGGLIFGEDEFFRLFAEDEGD